MKLFVLLISLLGANASLAQVAITPSSPLSSRDNPRVSDHRYLSVSNSIINSSSQDETEPFYLEWYFSEVPAEGCRSFNPVLQPGEKYSVGYQYIDGLIAGAKATGLLLGSDLGESVNESGSALPEGSYCLWSSANYSMQLSQIDNFFVFPDSVCYGNQCPNSEDQKLLLYPNPTTTEIQIEFLESFQSGTGTLLVFDILGKKMVEQKISFTSSPLQLNVSSLPSGTYIITVIEGTESISSRFVKQ